MKICQKPDVLGTTTTKKEDISRISVNNKFRAHAICCWPVDHHMTMKGENHFLLSFAHSEYSHHHSSLHVVVSGYQANKPGVMITSQVLEATWWWFKSELMLLQPVRATRWPVCLKAWRCSSCQRGACVCPLFTFTWRMVCTLQYNTYHFPCWVWIHLPQWAVSPSSICLEFGNSNILTTLVLLPLALLLWQTKR